MVDTLTLEQGIYRVECRQEDAAATEVPLHVAWSSQTGAEQAADVVVRVFDTPDDWK